MRGKNLTDILKKKYDTNNPFKIAKELNIIILYEELGTIKGYYNSFSRQKFIHINNNLCEEEKLFTCAHELGHALMHPKANTPFLKNNTLFSINRLEIEANQFAVDLLINDFELKTLIEENLYTTYQLSDYFRLDLDIINYKLKRLYKNF